LFRQRLILINSQRQVQTNPSFSKLCRYLHDLFDEIGLQILLKGAGWFSKFSYEGWAGFKNDANLCIRVIQNYL